MPLRTQTYNLADEIERLEAELQDIAETVVGLEDGNPLKQEKAQEGNQVELHINGLRWARDEAADDDGVPVWDEPAETVTLSGLTAGEFGHVEDTLVNISQQGGNSLGMGAHRIHNVAKGSVEAPYVDDAMSHQERVGAVGQLPNAYVRWANARINDLTSVEGNGGPRFGDLLADAREKQT